MQTSLDWFLENLPERFKYALLNTCEEGIKKAKQKEKEQIKESFEDGISEATNEQHGKLDYNMDAEKYYNQTYNQNKYHYEFKIYITKPEMD